MIESHSPQMGACSAARKRCNLAHDDFIEQHVVGGSEAFQCGRRIVTTGGEKGASHVARHFAGSDYCRVSPTKEHDKGLRTQLVDGLISYPADSIVRARLHEE
jgi:hypothetical protein